MKKEKMYLPSDSTVIKLVVMACLILLMLVPISMIKSMIQEREKNKTSEQIVMNEKWGGKQKLKSTLLVVPYKEANSNAVKNLYFLPEEYSIDGEINPEERIRGIQKILSYQSVMKVSGKFEIADYTKLDVNADQLMWNDAYFFIGVTKLESIQNAIEFKLDGQLLKASPNQLGNDLFNLGLSIKAPLKPMEIGNALTFEYDLILNGADGLHIIPIGKRTNIHFKSDWKSVSYVGDIVPAEMGRANGGFDSQWNIFNYDRQLSVISNGDNPFKGSEVGVDLYLPIDHYDKTMRAVKYAILFITLTFLVFFIIEILGHKRIHPIQYLLVSFAMVLFYTLLLALSEHINFALSYLISSVATITLITAYSKSVFKNIKQTLIMGVFLTALYVYLYVVLQQENMALLFGSIGLFIALAIVMYVSRKVNWYGNKEETEQQG